MSGDNQASLNMDNCFKLFKDKISESFKTKIDKVTAQVDKIKKENTTYFWLFLTLFVIIMLFFLITFILIVINEVSFINSSNLSIKVEIIDIMIIISLCMILILIIIDIIYIFLILFKKSNDKFAYIKTISDEFSKLKFMSNTSILLSFTILIQLCVIALIFLVYFLQMKNFNLNSNNVSTYSYFTTWMAVFFCVNWIFMFIAMGSLIWIPFSTPTVAIQPDTSSGTSGIKSDESSDASSDTSSKESDT